jgi:hypothetical protein
MSKAIQVWDGTQFVPANVPVGAVPNAVAVYNSASPTNAQVGTAWFDTNTNKLKVYSGSAWIEVSVDLSGYATLSSPTFTGQIAVPSGTASAPSISPSGDTNTGLFFPAADTLAFSSNGTERMRINSSGQITMPDKPMFMGFPTTDYSSGGMPTGVIAFTASYNNGNHYNAANSRFTCPIAGWYRVTWGGLQLGATVTSLRVNGTRMYSGNHFVSGAAYITMTQTVVRSFAANDFLEIEGWNGGGYYNGWYLWSVEQIA